MKLITYSTINNELEIFIFSFQCGYESRTFNKNWILFRNKLSHLADTHIATIRIACDKLNPWCTKLPHRLTNRRKDCLAVLNK